MAKQLLNGPGAVAGARAGTCDAVDVNNLTNRLLKAWCTTPSVYFNAWRQEYGGETTRIPRPS